MKKDNLEENNSEEIKEILNSKEAEKENDKKKIPIANGIIVGGIVIFIIMCILREKELIESNTFNKVTWILIIVGISMVFYIYRTKDYANKKYKDSVMPNIIENIIGGCYYDADKFIDINLYYKSGLFEKKERTTYTGSDYIEYDRDKINTVASKLKVTYTTGSGKSTSHHTQFVGEYFINIFEKKIKDEKVIIEYNKKLSTLDKIIEFLFLNIALILTSALILLFAVICELGIIASIIIFIVIVFVNLKKYQEFSNLDELRKFGERYGKEFSEMFLMRGNYVIADKILTRDLKNILLEFKKYEGIKTNISIRNNSIYIAFETKRDLFNAKILDGNKQKYANDYYLMKEIRKVNDFIADKVLKVLK